MNNKNRDLPGDDDPMQLEYDFSRGVRGKHAAALQRGYRIRIQQADGTTIEEDWRLPEGAVNKALRGQIELIPDTAPRE